MNKYVRWLIGIITVSLLIATIVAPIDYLNILISDLGLFSESTIIHLALTVSVFLGGLIILNIWSYKNDSLIGLLYTASIFVFMISSKPIFEWTTFWILCGWVIMRLIKNDKNDKKD